MNENSIVKSSFFEMKYIDIVKKQKSRRKAGVMFNVSFFSNLTK